MVFSVIGGDGKPTGYDISNSLRFNDGDSPKLERTVGTPTDEKIYTISIWVKKANNNVSNYILGTPPEGDRLSLGDNILFMTNGSSDAYLQTARKTRDVSAFYHIVIAYDTTQGTAANRIKLYINGEQYTWDTSTTFPSQNNTNGKLNKSGETFQIGTGHGGDYGDGYFSEFHFVDGQALAPTNFGETNNNGVWVPIEYDGTYGNNGFYLQFKQTGTSANSSGIGADTSGQDNHFAVTNLGATDVTEDTCTNNFATLNSIDTHTTSPTLAEGNTDFTGVNGTVQTPARSTIAVSSGKWYMEYKYKTADGGVGIMTTQSPINDHLRDDADVRSLWRGSSGGYYYGRNESGAIDAVGDNSETFSADDIGMIALDLDNGNVYFGKNGTWFKGQDGSTTGVPTSGSSGTGSANHPSQLLTNQHDGVWAFMAFDRTESSTGRVICNFGNPPYTPSSGNTDGKYGNFEYAPPSGFYALCTKRLAEFG